MLKELRFKDLAIVFIFMAGIFLPALAGLLPFNRGKALDENRSLSSFSKAPLSLQRLERLPKEFESYYDDHFPLRDVLVRFYNKFTLMVLDESPQEDVVLGEDGWMFYAGNHILEDILAVEPLSQEELELRRRIIEGKRDWLAERGVAYVFLVAPNKHSIYKERMPEDYQRLSGRSRFDQLIDYLKTHSDIELIDLRTPLLRVRDQYDLFYRTDTHWNEYGGFFAYQHLLEALNQRLTSWQARPYELSDYTITSKIDKGGDLARQLAVDDTFKIRYYDFTPKFESCIRIRQEPDYLGRKWQIAPPEIWECDRAAGKMVVFHDSFIGNIRKFLTEHFQRSVFIWLYHHDFNLLKQAVEAEQPDLVLEQLQERFIETMHLEQQFPGPSWEQQFADSQDTVLEVTPATSLGQFSHIKQMKVAASSEGIILNTSHRKARLELPELEVPKTVRSVVRVEITCPQETFLRIEYHSRKYNDYSEYKLREVSVAAGRNIVYIGIPNLDFSGRLRLRPGKKPGRYILHHLEVRSAL